MASNRVRNLRNLGSRMNLLQARMQLQDARPAPRKLARNFITNANIVRTTITNPLMAPDAIENENLADDAVGTSEIQLDAMNGKNITSCNISDCTMSTTDISLSTITTSTITESTISTSDLDSCLIADTDIQECLITNSEIQLCELSVCTADTISAISGGLSLVGSPVSVNGGFAVSGGTTMTVADGSFGLSASGSGITAGGGSMNMSVGSFQSFTVNGLSLNTRNEYIALLNRVTALETSKADVGHSHPGL